jgi:hypothetical protein
MATADAAGLQAEQLGSTTLAPCSSTSQCTGRAKPAWSPQRIGLGIGIAAIASRRISGSRLAVLAPGVTARCTKRSPLLSVVFSSAVQSIPALAAKPCRLGRLAFGVQRDVQVRAQHFAVLLRLFQPTPGSSTARRRGVDSGRASPSSSATPRLRRPSTTPSKNAWARPGSALTGSSSVPSSISRQLAHRFDPVVGAARNASGAPE